MLATSRVKQPTPNTTTISSGPRNPAELVTVAEIESGNIATASTMPRETIESAIASNPMRIPLRRRNMPILIR